MGIGDANDHENVLAESMSFAARKQAQGMKRYTERAANAPPFSRHGKEEPMTTEERLDRIEHVTAAIAEDRRADREENRQLWRDTQRQINELSARVVQMGDELREADRRLGNRIEQIAEEMRASDQRARTAEQELRDRITSLVSAIGQLTARMGVPPQPPAQG